MSSKSRRKTPQVKFDVRSDDKDDDDDGNSDDHQDKCPQKFEPDPNFPYPDTPSLKNLKGLNTEISIIETQVIQPYRFRKIFKLQHKTHQNLMMYGPGGTGKTSIAQAIAKDLDMEFLSIRPSQIQSSFQAQSKICFSKLIQTTKILAETTEKQGVLLLFDEGEELFGDVKKDSPSDLSIVSEFKNLVSATALDKIIIVLNTNLPYRITDSAVLRRFGVKLYIGLPDEEGRIEIMTQTLNNIYSDQVQFGCPGLGEKLEFLKGQIRTSEVLAKATRAYTPAELVQLIKIATSKGGLSLDNLNHLNFCRIESKKATKSNLPTANDHRIYKPSSLHQDDQEVEFKAPKTRKRNSDLNDVRECIDALDLERSLENDEFSVTVCWPIVDFDKILETAINNTIKRSVSESIMKEFLEYSSKVLIDFEGVTRIENLITILRDIQNKATGWGERKSLGIENPFRNIIGKINQ